MAGASRTMFLGALPLAPSSRFPNLPHLRLCRLGDSPRLDRATPFYLAVIGLQATAFLHFRDKNIFSVLLHPLLLLFSLIYFFL